MGITKEHDVVIIGAGQCGTALAYYLHKENISYILLEQNRAFSSWHQRWDGFKVNTSNWMNRLPGELILSNESNNRQSKLQIIKSFEHWLNQFPINIKISKVTSLSLNNSKWSIETASDNYLADHVVVAIGLNKAFYPKLYNEKSSQIMQFHSSEYKNSDQVKTKNVLIVGSGSSGVQICEELAKTRQYLVTLACSNNNYFSWTLFGFSIYSYIKLFKVFDLRSQSMLGRSIQYFSKNKGDPATPPKPITLNRLYNVALKGKLTAINNDVAEFEDCSNLDLKNTTIIWCTGYRVNYDALINDDLKSRVLSENGYPLFKSEFESEVPGLFFIGLRFQRLISSHTIYGAVRDAKYLVNIIHKILTKRK